MNGLKVFLLTTILFVSTLSAQNSTTIWDINSSVDKWSPTSRVGLYVMEQSNPIMNNSVVSVTDASNGKFHTKLTSLKRGKEYQLFLYSPYIEGKNLIDNGKIKVQIPEKQNGKELPLNFGTTTVTRTNYKPLELNCDIVARNTNIILKLSSQNRELNNWLIKEIKVVAEDGIISGDALLDVTTGSLTPDPNGKNSNSVSYIPEKPSYLTPEYSMINLKVIPNITLHGTKFRVDYTLSKDGKEITISHDIVGIDLHESYTYTLEERVPAQIANRWHMAQYPGENWEEVRPEVMGYSSAKLEKLAKRLQEEFTTTSMMIIVDGKVIKSIGDVAEPTRIASCRKSLLSMLYGKYVENGTVNLDLTLEELGIDDKGGLLPIERKATIRNLLTARSGVFHPAANDGDDTKHAPARGSVEPGSYYLYNNWDFNCVGGIFEQLTKRDIYDAFKDDIAMPIGMQDFHVENQHKTAITDPPVSNYLAYHFWLSTRDMARVAYLMLQNGRWNNTQVISEEWIKTTTATFTPRAEMNPKKRLKREFGYGYLWWTFIEEHPSYDPAIYGGGYTATGSGGQYITVLPALNMVIAHKDKSESFSKSNYYKVIAQIAACRE